MSTGNDQDPIGPVTRQGQIIVGALIVGVSIFLVLAVTLDVGGLNPGAGGPAAAGAGAAHVAPKQDSPLPLITYIALAFAIVALPMSVFVPSLIAKQQREAIARGQSASITTPPSGISPDALSKPAVRWPLAYLNQLIIGAALNEGAAFLAAVAYLVEKNPIALAVALALIAAIIARFPTTNRVERWIERQQEKLREAHNSPSVS